MNTRNRKGTGCRFRSLQRRDIPLLKKWLMNPDMQSRIEDEPLGADGVVKKLRNLVEMDPLQDQQGGFIIDYDGQAIGFVHIMWINWLSRTGEIDLLVDPSRHRSLLSFWVVQKAGEIAFEFLNLRKVYGYVFSSNTQSLRLFSRLITSEATLRGGRQPRSGGEDVTIVSLFAKDYERLKLRLKWDALREGRASKGPQ